MIPAPQKKGQPLDESRLRLVPSSPFKPHIILIHIKDDSRLLKRKEQNRAAQRAFRERKEKHVKDVSFPLPLAFSISSSLVGGSGSRSRDKEQGSPK